jgi:TonB family protein
MLKDERSSRVSVCYAVLACLLAVTALAATPLSSSAQAIITGSVTDTSGVPIFGAKVTLTGSTAAAETDEMGNFRLVNVPMGQTSVRVRRLGFLPFEVQLQLAQQAGAEVRVRMTPVVSTLPPVVVRPGHMAYTGRLAGYYKRLERKSSGYFISREEIDRDHPSTTGQLLQRVPGVQAVRGRGGITGVRLRGRTCWPLVWLDGMPMAAGEVDLDSFVPSSIQGIELYLGATTAPLAYIYDRSLSSCGTILIWSRGPDTDPIHSPRSAASDLEGLVSQLAVYTVQTVDRRARLDSTQALNLSFPQSLFASRTQGLVVAEFVVDTLGRVEDGTVGIVSSTAPLFTDAVRVALATATFIPALKDGHPVRQLVHQPFEFDVGSAVAQRP